jgi:hypothetical protein
MTLASTPWSFTMSVLPGKTSASRSEAIQEAGVKLRRSSINACYSAPIVTEKFMLKRSFSGKLEMKQQENCWKPKRQGVGNQQPSPREV